MLKVIKYNFYVSYIRIPYKILSGDLKVSHISIRDFMNKIIPFCISQGLGEITLVKTTRISTFAQPD